MRLTDLIMAYMSLTIFLSMAAVKTGALSDPWIIVGLWALGGLVYLFVMIQTNQLNRIATPEEFEPSELIRLEGQVIEPLSFTEDGKPLAGKVRFIQNNKMCDFDSITLAREDGVLKKGQKVYAVDVDEQWVYVCKAEPLEKIKREVTDMIVLQELHSTLVH